MRSIRAIAAACLLAGALPGSAIATAATPPPVSEMRAGVGIEDATWHVGTGSGQYAAKNPNAAGLATGAETDPFFHGQTQTHSYGVQSRLTYRALVVEGSNGKRIALVKSDSYLAQDYLTRRAQQVLTADGYTMGLDQILLHVTHNHSSPYYMTPSWGVWLFQDTFEMRTFEYHARAMAHAIEKAIDGLRPVRIGATTIRHTIYKGMIAGQTITDDGTPGGYPETSNGSGGHGDFDDTILRVDDVSGQSPAPLAIWVNHGQHPESNDAYDLISADYLGPLERDVERATGAPLVFSQADVGSSEGPYYRGTNEVLPDGVLRAWAHVGHSQTERGAKYLADSIVQAWTQIGDGGGTVPFTTDAPVDYLLRWTPGPLSHPYPSVSNCRTEPTAEGDPGVPVAGLPDCERAGAGRQAPLNAAWATAKDAGLPLPEQYDAAAFGAVEENLRIKLQTMRIGGILFASCSCEAQNDLILNLKSRTDTIPGNFADGFDWGQFCTQNPFPDTRWTCTRPSTIVISDERYRHMEAEVHNDAKGWNDPQNAVAANAEPSDPAKIWGNFTKEELSPSLGYAIPVGIGHAGDYDGYTVSYREYMSRDHYRKALTAYGAHTADYMVTNLVHMAAEMNGATGPHLDPLDPGVLGDPAGTGESARLLAMSAADEARQQSVALALGAVTGSVYDAWTASLPDDLQPAGSRIVTQPSDVTRFQAATLVWHGGSNAADNPRVTVERLASDGRWMPFADQTGEVQTMVRFPKGAAGVAKVYQGAFDWQWTASFEAFDAFPRSVIPGGQIPNGEYRFTVAGASRSGGASHPYSVTSNPFHVGPWQGITVSSPQVDANGDVSFVVDPVRYPRTYSSPLRFVKDSGDAVLCKTCSFRPWASRGTVASALVTVQRGAMTSVVPALLGGDGRWHAATQLAAGDTASIEPGGVSDTFGEVNGARTAF